MLPLHQAYEVREAVLEYIRATFRFREADVNKAFNRFIEDERDGLFKGPFVSLKTPFVKAKEGESIPLDIQPAFTPHLHQIEAFRRLTTKDGHQPQPTLLTTGTGSGKTECFLFPVLDYVYQMNRNGRRQGVKVIIMYPMNALAGDQAKRLAETIWNDTRLKGRVTAGLFIGEGVDRKAFPTMMGEHNIIENRETIVNEAPDIVLTNFKMLDYALMQQRYMPLWKGNIGADKPMLRFMVLDELHTYDGAQGTDVANLIRRLKLKLNIPGKWLTPCGTSATIGNGADSKKLLCEYAGDVFGETFGTDSIIEEHRMSVDDFFDEKLDEEMPSGQALKTFNQNAMKGTEAYLLGVRRLWMPRGKEDPISIGQRVKGLQIAKDLLTVTSKGMLTLPALMSEMGRLNSRYQRILRYHPDQAKSVVESLLALISEAKSDDGRTPLLYLQIQLWQRELSGIQRLVQSEPEFTWRDAIVKDGRVSLPIWFCRECGASGWLTTKRATEQRFGSDTSKIIQAFMGNDRDVRLMSTECRQHEPLEEYMGAMTVSETYYIRTNDLTIGAQTDDNVLRVRVLSRGVQARNGNVVRLDKHCPLCMGEQLAIVGGRTSTLSSVAVSQIMSSDFDAREASKRKMLTFSNSVQDAAHLAGFYEVRTFRFLFRQSIQQYLKTVGHPISLADLQKGFKTFWKERLTGDEYYYRFIPDEYVEKIDLEKNYRDKGGDLSMRFKSEFDLRVDWEICSEFGLRAQIGRTLEKTGASATFFKEEDIRKVFEAMKPWLSENNMGYVAEHEQLFLRFVNGILHRMRMRGGVDHEFLRLYRTQQLRPFMLHWPRQWRQEHFLYKGFGGNRIPRMVGYQNPPNDDVLDVTSTRGNHANWFYTYFVNAIHNPSGEWNQPNPEAINDFFKELLEKLTECDILNRRVTGTNRVVNYAIRPDAIYVEPSVRHIKCDACESMMCVAKSDTLTERTHCIDFKCKEGEYRNEEPNADNYYQRVYNREISPRIYSHEHTGLLERRKREEIEQEFREHPTPHSCNVLTATSTLEMGIDIGDLNVVANTGIPPKPSNFLQRVGRAGRKEGSALVLNYAKASKHDMFYFAEPLQMMQGEVATPGCFLEARDILRRHFYAFCVDSWTSADRNNVIPPKIGLIGDLGNGLTARPSFFANRIGEFIRLCHDQLMERFCRQYPDKTRHVLDELRQMVSNGILQKRVIDEFDALVEQLERIKAERAELRLMLEGIPMNDIERREDIINQGRCLRSKERAIKEESVIEFMTNAGLLPNYAFPETGVKLSATIFNRKAPGDETENIPDPEALEIVRPAAEGIRELAPGNDFYTQKLKLAIKGLSLNDRTDSVKTMRYCSECDALAEEGTDEFNAAVCPKCGSESWRGNQHKFLRFTTATTSVARSDAALDDKADDREQKFYHTMKHFRFNHSGTVTSYGLNKVAFGIEFCKDVVLTECNYGSRDQLAEPVEINKTPHISALDFVTCKHCGKSTAIIYGREEPEDFHFPYCNHKEVAYPPDEAHQDTFDNVYLYREMQTEAIKVLLPVRLFDTGATIELFKAGIELGMRHYYKSSPDHIRIDAYKEYNLSTHNFDNYLVIYDTIPGGTGYLSKLYDTKEFTQLIRISYEHIRDCGCQYEGKDGCYHCILSYGNQWHRDNLSRERAEQLFKNIYDECNNWETVNGSIGTITTSGVVEDSELEILFVKTIEKIAKENSWRWSRQTDAINETYSYELVIIDDKREIKYVVYPQYRLGTSLGVPIETIPDFQFICSYAKVDGNEIEPQCVPQWSVYVDGYAYHASEEHMRFYNDFQRREAIRLSRREPRLSWTLTWADIKPYVESDGKGCDFVDPLYVDSPDQDLLEDFANEIRHRRNSVSRFVFMLANPIIEDLRADVFAFLASCYTDEDRMVVSYDGIEGALVSTEPAMNDVSDVDRDNLHFFAKTSFIQQNSLTSGTAWYPYDQESDYANSVRYDWHLAEGLNEIGREEWTDFWRRYDLLQFFSNKPLTAMGNQAIDIDEITPFFPGLETQVEQLIRHNIPFNVEGGYELKDEDGIIIAEAAIKLDGKNVVIDDFSGRADAAESFRQKGFVVISAQDFNINTITAL